MAQILHGKPLAEKINEQTALASKGKKIAILLPDDPASKSYGKTIAAKADKLGIEVVANETEADGAIGKVTDPTKDIDCQTEENLGKLFAGKPLFKPATAEAVLELLQFYEIEISGKNAVVIGKSTIVGKPLALLLLDEGATVTVCHSKTRNLAAHTKNADIVVSAVGKANLVTADMVKMGAVVIDVGTNFVDGELVGDVDFENVKNVVSAISPVPGGVGPVTTSILLRACVQSGFRS